MSVQEFAMGSQSRRREVANAAIDVPHYLALLQAWRDGILQEGEWLGLDTYLEPQQASSLRQVCPAAVVRLAPLLRRLLEGGLENCVVFPAKWEAACVSFAGQINIMKKSGDCRHAGATFATHAYNCLAILRVFVQEDMKSIIVDMTRRHPKTGQFR